MKAELCMQCAGIERVLADLPEREGAVEARIDEKTFFSGLKTQTNILTTGKRKRIGSNRAKQSRTLV